MGDAPGETKPNTLIYQRRRRKRNRPQPRDESSNESNSTKASRIAQEFCDRFAFLDKDGDELADKRPRFRSLSVLLEERRSGKWKRQPKQWQSEMLFAFTKKPDRGIARRQWRPYANRTIPFTKLGSPPTDAVLAMNKSGDYLLTVGSSNVGLALRFYGIHSAAAKKRSCQFPTSAWKAPLLQTTPLRCCTGQYPSDDPLMEYSPSNTSVELIVSKDWKVGVARLHPNVLFQGQTPSMAFFTLPQRNTNEIHRVFEFNRKPMSNNEGPYHESIRKILWQVESIPNTTQTNNQCDTYFRAPGYLLLNYEGNSVQMNWATEKRFLVSSCLSKVSMDYRFLNGTKDAAILSHAPTPSWTEVMYDGTNGTIANGNKHEDGDSQVCIVSESVLLLDVLLAKVLSGRKGFSETRPRFCYSLVSVNCGGRIADFVLAFWRRTSALAFYVTIDLFTGIFVELDWVQTKPKSHSFVLKKWCHALSLNRRMKQLRAGPFAVTDKTSTDCSRLCQETFCFDNDEEDDFDENYWREFVQAQREKKKCQAPKLVTLSSLYPCCDVITNQAILNMEPVMSIRAKDSPIRLVYT